RRFGKSDDFHLLPEATRGRLLWQNDDAAMAGVTFGFARGTRAGSFGYSFGNPIITAGGVPMANHRNAGALVLRLGLLTACVAVTFFEAEVALPEPYAELRGGETFRSIRRVDGLAQVDAIRIDNDPIDVRRRLAAIEVLSSQSPAA